MAKDVQVCQRRNPYLLAIFVFYAVLCMLLSSIPLISTTPLAPDKGPSAALPLLPAPCGVQLVRLSRRIVARLAARPFPGARGGQRTVRPGCGVVALPPRCGVQEHASVVASDSALHPDPSRARGASTGTVGATANPCCHSPPLQFNVGEGLIPSPGGLPSSWAWTNPAPANRRASTQESHPNIRQGSL